MTGQLYFLEHGDKILGVSDKMTKMERRVDLEKIEMRLDTMIQYYKDKKKHEVY